MMVLAFAAFGLVISAWIMVHGGYDQTQRLSASQTDIASTNFNVYRVACLNFIHNNPSFIDVIPDASLQLPAGYANGMGWQNRVSRQDGNQLYVYSTTQVTQPFLSALLSKSGGSVMVGRVVNNRLVNPVTGDASHAVPVQIPNGAVIMAGR